MKQKNLDEMTFEELGRLFPIILSEHNPEWREIFEREKKAIIAAAGEYIIAVHHIGSTAVEGLKAKPTIDIAIEIKNGADLKAFKDSVINIGYEMSWQKDNPPPHMMFMKGYSLEGFKGQAYHLHVRYTGGFADELIFRDYLRGNEKARRDYAELKIKLQKQYEFDREGYTQSKGEFIKNIVGIKKP